MLMAQDNPQGDPQISISQNAVLTIEQQNPWQSGAKVPPEFAPDKERDLVQNLYRWLRQSKSRHIQVILGPRRVGKTVALYQVVRNLLADGVPPSRIFFLRLDHFHLRATTLENLARYVVQMSGATVDKPAYLMLDEVVLMENWDGWLKTFHDDIWPLRIVATSSARTGLKLGQTESGLDRWREQYMLPCRLVESLKLLNEFAEQEAQISVGPTLRETIDGLQSSELQHTELPEKKLEIVRNMLLQVGGFPGILTSFSPPDQSSLFGLPETGFFPLPHQIQLYENVAEKSIYNDIPKYFNVTDPSSLETILFRAARQMGTLWEPTKVSNDLGVKLPTLNNYTKYLEMASLIVMLQNYPGGEGETQSRGKKLYFIDTALRNAVLRYIGSREHAAADFGHMLENLVVSSLFSLAEQTRFRLYHWRHGKAGAHEVDVIYNDVNHPLAFEVGASSDHSLSGLHALIDKHPKFFASSYLVSPNAPFRPAGLSPNGIGSLPLDLLLMVCDLQASHALYQRFNY